VYRCDLDGTSIRDIYHDKLACTQAIAVDEQNGRIYWGEEYSASPNLRSADLDGTNIKNVVMASVTPEGIVLDLDAGKIYWTDSNTDKIQRANLNGSNIEDLYAMDEGSPWAIAMDHEAGIIYWTVPVLGFICRGSKDGGPADTLLSDLGGPLNLVLDEAGGKMYWDEYHEDLILCANLDGSDPDTLFSDIYVGGLAIDSRAGKLYWSTPYSKNALHRCNLDGSGREVVAAGSQGIRGMDIDPTTGVLYWTRSGKTGIGRTDPEQGDLTLLLSEASDPEGLALDPVNYAVYWVDAWTGVIHRSDMYGTKVDILVQDLERPHDIALDIKRNKMYWADDDRRIQRANLDGSRIETLVDRETTGLRPRALALDVTGRRIYWLDRSEPAIYISPLEGGSVERICSAMGRPGKIFLDRLNHHMYWTADENIYRANMDGSSPEVILTLTEPLGISVDVARGHIYWVDFEDGNLQRADLDGSNITEIVPVIYRPNSIELHLE
jgi:low density lipoprotein receptor-related protein 5/6